MMATLLAMHMAFSPLLAVHGPDLAELIEQSECAARAKIVARVDHEGADVSGVVVRAEASAPLWGECPASFAVFCARTASHDRIDGDDVIVGLTHPNDAQCAHLGLVPGTYLLAGALPASDDLCASVRVLRSTPGCDQLLRLLDPGAHHDARVRRQAFRQISQRLGRRPDAGTLSSLVPLAEAEDDPTLAEAYIAMFGETRCAQAAPFVIRALLTAEHDGVADSAKDAFPKLATPLALRELAAAFDHARPAVKARILDAAAACGAPEAQELLEHALAAEETVVQAVAAMRAAGRGLPTTLPRVYDPVRRQRLRALVSDYPVPTQALRPAPSTIRR